MPQFDSINAAEFQKYLSKQIFLRRFPFEVGVEIEQAAEKTSDGTPCQPVIKNPNDSGMPLTVPPSLMHRSRYHDGHFDLSLPWEFNLGHDNQIQTLMKRFNEIIAGDRWAWHNTFRVPNEIKGASTHFHMSVLGEINMGSFFAEQKIAPFEFWAYLWNGWVTLLPITIPFWAFGQRFRTNAFKGKRWAMPVIDRLEAKDVVEIFKGNPVNGVYSRDDYPTHVHQLGHQYHALAWNRKDSPGEHYPKKAVTIEMRLCENHPYWFLPALEKVNLIIKGTMVNCNPNSSASIKLADHRVVERWWEIIPEYDVYEALLRIENVNFQPKRELPYIMRDAQSKQFETALDLFRSICRRLRNSRKNNILKSNKVLRMFGDFINLDKVPANLIWDIDELYRQLYVDENRKTYQDRYLYFGSAAVIDDDENETRIRNKSTVKNLLAKEPTVRKILKR